MDHCLPRPAAIRASRTAAWPTMSTKSIRFLMSGMKTIWQLQRYLAGVIRHFVFRD